MMMRARETGRVDLSMTDGSSSRRLADGWHWMQAFAPARPVLVPHDGLIAIVAPRNF
ncbi:hypothetical protein WKI45_10785 [Delftia tsuruhatensis]